MDLLIEKLDGSRYYLSQYKVLITDFEESAPSVTRNSKQLDQRNGNIDFGGWHTDKTISVTGYYRADDMDEEETLREKLYALLSDPNGYYITQLKTTPNVAMERPGETSGSYYDKLSNYPSHKRFLVYTEAPEMELVGNVNGTLLYKLTAEFKTLKLPYGETPKKDLKVAGARDGLPYNLLTGTTANKVTAKTTNNWGVTDKTSITVDMDSLNTDDGIYTFSAVSYNPPFDAHVELQIIDADGKQTNISGSVVKAGTTGVSVGTVDFSQYSNIERVVLRSPVFTAYHADSTGLDLTYSAPKLQSGPISSAGVNLLMNTDKAVEVAGNGSTNFNSALYRLSVGQLKNIVISVGDKFSLSYDWELISGDAVGSFRLQFNKLPWGIAITNAVEYISLTNTHGHASYQGVADVAWTTSIADIINARLDGVTGVIRFSNVMFAKSSSSVPYRSSPYDWTPNPADPEFNPADPEFNIVDRLPIKYSGTVPCNQLEQGFIVEFTAKDNADKLSFTLNNSKSTELTFTGKIVAGDVFRFGGFSYTQNGLSIVSKTNKAYFILQPDKPNRITCNVPGTVRILGFQNLYA